MDEQERTENGHAWLEVEPRVTQALANGRRVSCSTIALYVTLFNDSDHHYMVEKVAANVAYDKGGLSEKDPGKPDTLELKLMKPAPPCDSLMLGCLVAHQIGEKTPSKPEEVEYSVAAYYRFEGKKYFAVAESSRAFPTNTPPNGTLSGDDMPF